MQPIEGWLRAVCFTGLVALQSAITNAVMSAVLVLVRELNVRRVARWGIDPVRHSAAELNHRKNHRKMGKGGGSCSSSETVRLQEEERSRNRAQKEQADTERAEQERIANLPRMSVNFISPPPATKFEFHVEETVDGALKTVAPHYGLEKSDAPLLQLQFSETVLTPKQQLTAEECATSPNATCWGLKQYWSHARPRARARPKQ